MHKGHHMFGWGTSTQKVVIDYREETAPQLFGPLEWHYRWHIIMFYLP